jgi:hypothetical protein
MVCFYAFSAVWSYGANGQIPGLWGWSFGWDEGTEGTGSWVSGLGYEDQGVMGFLHSQVDCAPGGLNYVQKTVDSEQWTVNRGQMAEFK